MRERPGGNGIGSRRARLRPGPHGTLEGVDVPSRLPPVFNHTFDGKRWRKLGVSVSASRLVFWTAATPNPMRGVGTYRLRQARPRRSSQPRRFIPARLSSRASSYLMCSTEAMKSSS